MFQAPPLLARPCSSISSHQTPCLCLTRSVQFYLAPARGLGLVWGFRALPDLMPPQTLRKPISKAIRQSDIQHLDIRQPDTRPYTNKEQKKTINPKQGKAQTGPPSHGKTKMARASGMSQNRSTYPRNIKFQLAGASLGI